MNMVIISGSKEELKVVEQILCDFNNYAVQYETDEHKTFLQTDDCLDFEYKLELDK